MDLSEDLIGLYRGWNSLEAARPAGGLPVIDFDLLGSGPERRFSSREEVLAAFEAIQSEARRRHELLGDRVRASIAVLQSVLGEPPAFRDYIEATLGISPERIPRPLQDSQRSRVEELLSQYNLGYRRECRDAFVAQLTIDDARFSHELQTSAPVAIETVQKLLDIDVPVSLSWSTVRKNEYWKTWVSSRGSGHCRIDVNLAKRRPFYVGEPLILAFHEAAAHALQMAVWSANIRSGKLDRAFGVTTVHFAEQLISEGLAMSITDCLLDDTELSERNLFAREYDRHRLFVYHDAHIDVNSGEPVQSVIERCRDSLPFETLDAIRTELDQRRHDPIFRVYQFSYSCGDRLFLDSVRTLPRSVRLDLLRWIYSQPCSARTLGERIAHMRTQHTDMKG